MIKYLLGIILLMLLCFPVLIIGLGLIIDSINTFIRNEEKDVKEK